MWSVRSCGVNVTQRRWIAIMKRALILIAVFSIGFVSKVSIVEVERLATTFYVDQCFGQRKPTTTEGESECYRAAKNHAFYQAIATLNAQPALWKNTEGRCVGTEGTKADSYFECSWWNRFAI